jgi:hypothetical protein
MAIYELIAYNTDSRYREDVRYREYTTSKKRADLFNKIQKIQFSDSGHGIVFLGKEHTGRREPIKRELSSYVSEQMLKLNPPSKKILTPKQYKQRAAPDMYEALKNLVNRVDRGLALGEKLDIEPARQAIAKAEGGN